MAGHSKWANIKHKKAKEDEKRGKLFSKLSKEIIVAAKEGGGDPDKNNRLRIAIQKAKDNNMPNENIERAVKKGTGELEGVNYEELTYEGYGPAGIAVFLDVMTDNKNRTASEVRHLFTKNGGNLGENGCVAWMFSRKGLITLDSDQNQVDEEEFMLTTVEAGAEDVKIDEATIEVITDPQDFENVRQALEDQGLELSFKEVTMLPSTTVKVEGDDAKKVLKLLEELEDHDDVQNVYANFDIDDSLIDS
ncbi:YebC/PmpR family DNA-binding transcriptional regulator [Natranaerobius trueperi]|uniref:Probable transcriptional regulatory protein CDO51_08680 n=1 Tax=Natranaerobius trueperi TaxID=759412 RepID=A0A226BYP8_9FIRM|nr:YebC/PmpR family DNA-binding transcriptional regulator [Natranaerobius trueperi]OWZ83454.1 YebC/PmpR family DNA-binding transcriptional regulator [Natranaerobius trueperi]